MEISMHIPLFGRQDYPCLKEGQNMEMRPYDDMENMGGLMEISTRCSRFERRFDFDTFSMADYQSCENCRHLGPEDQCRIRTKRGI